MDSARETHFVASPDARDCHSGGSLVGIRWGCAVLALVCGLPTLLGCTNSQVRKTREGPVIEGHDGGTRQIVCDELIVRDTRGERRIVLRTQEDGDPVVALFDKNGLARAKLSLSEGEPDFSVFDGEGRCRMSIGLDSVGTSTIEFLDAAGHIGLDITLYSDGLGAIELRRKVLGTVQPRE